MKNKFLAMLTTLIFLMALGSPVMAATMYQGRPTVYDSNTSPSFQVWQEGDRWHVQTANTGMQQRLFTGTIESNGAFSDVTTMPSANVERIVVDVRDGIIDFQFNSLAKADGFSFTLRGSQNATFKLYIDGRSVDPSNIYLGQQNRHPDRNEFSINTVNDSYNNTPYNNGPYPVVPNTAYPTIVSANAQGEPTALDPGHAFGYFIWQDDQNRWFLNTTTNGEERRFTGSIESNGRISEVNTLRSDRTGGTVSGFVKQQNQF